VGRLEGPLREAGYRRQVGSQHFLVQYFQGGRVVDRDVASMTDQELRDEWLACERFISDPGASPVSPVLRRQLQVEAEQSRRLEDG